MATKTAVIIHGDKQKRTVYDKLTALPCDGSVTVTFSDTDKTSTARQRRLQWMWYTEIANSGKGQYDDKDDVSTACKLQFGWPIVKRDYPVLAEIIGLFIKGAKDFNEQIQRQWYAAKHLIHTEDFSREHRAEYLTCVQRYWISKGVNLTDPSLQGVDL